MLVPTILVQNEAYWLGYVLECLRGHFHRYVIYDVGSSDGTQEIIDNFVQRERQNAEFFVRLLPKCTPANQGPYRNAMMAEARSEWTFMVDGDELYTKESIEVIKGFVPTLQKYHDKDGLLYGIVPRHEVQADLRSAYGVGEMVPHHRLYHRTAIFGGPHPNEYQLYPGRPGNQMWLPKTAVCWHFHGALRSPKDAETHGRLDRKKKPTYLRGTQKNIDILKELPILRNPVNLAGERVPFPVTPALKLLQEEYMAKR